MRYIYCRGSDKKAPLIAKSANMLYGLRYDHTAYSEDVYMLDCGLNPKWSWYKTRIKQLRPKFALVPDLEVSRDPIQIQLYVNDLRNLGVPSIGCTPKYYGALEKLPRGNDIIICISVPSAYSGYLPHAHEIRPGYYHLLGGDPLAQMGAKDLVCRNGGLVVSADGNKLAMKAAHGQVFYCGHWVKSFAPTADLMLASAQNVRNFFTP